MISMSTVSNQAAARPAMARRALREGLVLGLVLILLASILLGGGCRRPGAGSDGPGGPGGSPSTPVVSLVSVSYQFPSNEMGFPLGGDREGTTVIWVGTGGNFTVGTEPVTFKARLDPLPDAAWLTENVTVEGPVASGPELESGYLVCTFGPGPAGESLSLTLSSVVVPHSDLDHLTVSLTRADFPTARLEAGSEGASRPVTSGDAVSLDPLTLRLVFSREMDRESVEGALEEAFGDRLSDVQWGDERTVRFTVEDPPPLVRPSVWPARDTDGLGVSAPIWRFYTGDPPTLYAFNPATGEEVPLLTLPTDIFLARLSPDGRTLLVGHFVERTHQTRTVLVRLNGGATVPLDGGYRYHCGWLGPDRLLRVREGEYEIVSVASGAEPSVPARGAYLAGMSYLAPSPDGRRLAGYVVRHDAIDLEPEGCAAPADLVVIDLETGEQQVLENLVSKWITPGVSLYEGLYSGLPFWSPDSARIAVIAERGERFTGKQYPECDLALRIIDPATGVVQSEVELTVSGTPGYTAGSWSPDGAYITVGEVVLSAAPPHERADFTAGGWGLTYWSPDSRWIAKSGGIPGWEWLSVHAAAPGAVPVLNEPGFPCGWDPAGRFLFIRWPAAQARYEPGLGVYMWQ